MEYAERLFTDIGGKRVYRVAKAYKPEQCPHTKFPEVRKTVSFLFGNFEGNKVLAVCELE